MQNLIQNTVSKANNWRFWLDGLIGAAVGGAANAVTIMLVKPESFNFTTGLTDLWHFTAISAMVSAALWVRSNPTPGFTVTVDGPPDSTTTTTVKSVTTPNPPSA